MTRNYLCLIKTLLSNSLNRLKMLINLSIKVITGHHETPNQASFALPDRVRLGQDYSEAGSNYFIQDFPKNYIRQVFSPTMAIRLCDTPNFQQKVKQNG